MDSIKLIKCSLEETRLNTLRAVERLPRDKLLWRPTPKANHALFLLWHIARVEDMFINRFPQRQAELWQRDKLYEKFALPEEDTGRGFDVATLDKLALPDLDFLLDYMKRVRENTLAYLKGLDAQKLDEVPHPDRPDFTIGRVLRQLVYHENQHLGGLEYLAGLMA